MSGHSALVRFAVLVSLIVPGSAFAQFPPPAGSAGAGNSAISGIPYGPANPSVVGDPSGIGNASRIPPPGTNTHGADHRLRFGQRVALGFARVRAALCGRVTTDHRPAPGKVKEAALPPARPG